MLPCSLIDIYRRTFQRYFLCLLQHHHRPDDGGSKHLWKVGDFYQTARRNIPKDSHPYAAISVDIRAHCDVKLSLYLHFVILNIL
jgi:hypothetical protein